MTARARGEEVGDSMLGTEKRRERSSENGKKEQKGILKDVFYAGDAIMLQIALN